ncbi:phosphoethanolamine--lipid A transferase [Paraglaciecola aquimarina]|uniref:Phosphoethanolamine--lipid A transferase n=1 Tax=Paraglaciecola aquimarina TaxID=1235557 RepID=A0ABU3SRR3_9ALTE|nr:phosphoethanolamine--lipid A transferase [Paraglaciecola aquimarina]MDU0352697.1 phosphoethanolamine--lipid A transferase [Paraglaciecola aquimarina]
MFKAINFLNHLKLTTNQLVVYSCVYITFVLNLPFLSKTMAEVFVLESYSLFFLISVPIFLLALSIFIQCLLSFRWLTKPLLILMVLLSSIILYSTVTYGIIFDYGMIQNTVETDKAEALSYFNFSAIMFFVSFGVIPSVFIAKIQLTYRSFVGELFARIKLLSGCASVILLILTVFYSSYASVGRNNRDLVGYLTPYAVIDSTVKYVRQNYLYPPLKFTLLDTSPTISHSDSTKSVTVLVLGETARSQSFSLNGYEKPTNARTEELGVVSFQDVSSCGTATAISVPCMFSRLKKENYDKRVAIAQQNVIDLIYLAGADVFWISNNNGSCKGVCSRVKTKQVSPNSNNPLCDGEYCFDEVLVEELRKRLYSVTTDHTLIVLHMIGSHGPTYYRRYPENRRTFLHDCRRSDIQNCTHEELVNTYNNTIAYTDLVLSEIINELETLSDDRSIKTSMIYVSDYGESLGESGVYLHGLPYAFAPQEQIKVPLIYWGDKLHHQAKLVCLNSIKEQPISHDNIFDILLGEMDVNSKMYQPMNNPFNQCAFDISLAKTTS